MNVHEQSAAGRSSIRTDDGNGSRNQRPFYLITERPRFLLNENDFKLRRKGLMITP